MGLETSMLADIFQQVFTSHSHSDNILATKDVFANVNTKQIAMKHLLEGTEYPQLQRKASDCVVLSIS